MARIPKPPDEFGDAGRRLWISVLREYDLSGADLEILRDAAMINDQIAALEQLLRVTGPLIRDGNGEPKANPASVQHRLQTAAKAKLLASIQVAGERADDASDTHDPDRPQRRSGFRGTYKLRAVE